MNWWFAFVSHRRHPISMRLCLWYLLGLSLFLSAALFRRLDVGVVA